MHNESTGRIVRLFLPQPFHAQALIDVKEEAAHYLQYVMRLTEGAILHVFNGKDGQWQAQIEHVGKKQATLRILTHICPQTFLAPLWLAVAPLRGGKTEWVVEKATELGVTGIQPVRTQHSVADKINQARWVQIATEAAEQCERLDVPTIAPMRSLEQVLGDKLFHPLIYGDESGASEPAGSILPSLLASCTHTPGLLIGPEGGFSVKELSLLRSLPHTHGVSMGPHILRADTAALSLLTLAQSYGGRWQGKPSFTPVSS